MFILYMNKKTKKNKKNKKNKMNRGTKRKMKGGGDKDKIIIINKDIYTYGSSNVSSKVSSILTDIPKYKFDNKYFNNETITLSFNGKYYTYKDKYYDLKGEELSEYELKNYVNVYDEIIKLKSDDDKEIKLNGIIIKLGET